MEERESRLYATPNTPHLSLVRSGQWYNTRIITLVARQSIIIVDFTALAGAKQQSAYLFNSLLNIEIISNALYNDFQLDGDLIIILNSSAEAPERQKEPFRY